jgi:hypothetical protein
MAIGKKSEYKHEEIKNTRDLVKELQKQGAEMLHSTGEVKITIGGNTIQYSGDFDILLVKR